MGWTGPVRVTSDTNLLVRLIVRDDPKQARLAVTLLEEAELVAIPLQALCEVCWVLARTYKFSKPDIYIALSVVLAASNVAVDRPPADAGLRMLEAGGDFADGVIAYQGSWLGGETFVSFDKEAVELLARNGVRTKLLR
jgi:predicted nucleic-acid-binding protein